MAHKAMPRIVALSAAGLVFVSGALIPGRALAQGKSPVAIHDLPAVEITMPLVPPEWALLERHLLERFYPSAEEFVAKYTRPDGTLVWRDKWPGMDGSDDGYESFYNFPLYYALGGPDEMNLLSRRLWEAVTRQFTNYGQIDREFDAHYDWMHHGEGYTNFYFFGLCDPTDKRFRDRAVRFAGLYLNEDPQAANYDAAQKLIRSPLTGSRGPHFVNTVEDWVTHRPVLAHYPLPYDDIPGVDSSDAWNDNEKFPLILQAINERMMRGDVPLNLTATSLILNAFMYTQDEKYKRWIEEYVSAWMQRVRENGGILPDNVGLSGKIGEFMQGKWWGGYYGWRWPHGLFNQLESTVIGATNAYLVSGNPNYLQLPRTVLKVVEGQTKAEGGRLTVPHRHADQGWYDFRPLSSNYPVHLWFASRDEGDWQRAVRWCKQSNWDHLVYRKGKGDAEHCGAWLGYLEGRNPDYPAQILRATYGEMHRRLAMIRADRSTPDEQDVHHWQNRNPVILEGLVQLMLGGPNHIYHGGLLQVSLRYFDPDRARPGLPPDVAALVERVSSNGIAVRLVNLHPTQSRQVILQAGAFGEHRFTSVRHVTDSPSPPRAVDGRCFVVHLSPGAGGQLEVGLRRFAQQPTYAFPWHNDIVQTP